MQKNKPFKPVSPKKLNILLNNVKVVKTIGDLDQSINQLHLNSTQIQSNDLFAAIKGYQTDGHQYIATAIEQGAIAIVCETLPEILQTHIVYIQVEKTSQALAEICKNFYENPSQKLKLIGVTGTNGKTSVATLLYQLFSNFGYKSGLLSTIINRIGTEKLPATHTTSDVIQLNENLKKMADQGCEFCFMEVSSHAADQNRIAGLNFAGGIFTNLTHDHLDYHQNFKNYLEAKQKFFDHLTAEAFVLSNLDDPNGTVIVQNTKAKKYFYSLEKPTDFKGKIIENNLEGLTLEFNQQSFSTQLMGKFNAYNLLAVYGCSQILFNQEPITNDRHIKFENLLVSLSALNKPQGRLEHFVTPTQLHIFIDYAHTPDALENVLKTLNEIRGAEKNIKIISVFGCGGNRDPYKRPKMASIAEKYSDAIFLTSDNPREEDPKKIIAQMRAGLKNKRIFVHEELDRFLALKAALDFAKAKDIVLIAGKGHETYQIIGQEKVFFSDLQTVQILTGMPINLQD